MLKDLFEKLNDLVYSSNRSLLAQVGPVESSTLSVLLTEVSAKSQAAQKDLPVPGHNTPSVLPEGGFLSFLCFM